MGEDKFTISLSDLDIETTYVSANSANTITLDSDFLNDSGSEYTYNIPGHPDSLGEMQVESIITHNLESLNLWGTFAH